MADIVIKKRVSLEFLGDDYKDSYLVFKSIPVSDLEDLTKKIDEVSGDNTKSFKAILEILESRFIEGLFEGQKVTPEDLKQFDTETVVKCFETFTGQVDPKVEGQ